MKASDKILAEVKRTFPAPSGYQGLMEVEARAYHISGNSHPHFSVTCAIGTPRELKSGDWQAGGCMHDEIEKAWPEIKPIIALHLSNADNGEPMYAEENGFYWLAGAVGGLGEDYHGGSGSSEKAPEECLAILAKHLRIELDAARHLAEACKIAHDAGLKSPIQPTMAHLRAGASASHDPDHAANTAAKNVFKTFVASQRDRWQKEAAAGLALLETNSVLIPG